MSANRLSGATQVFEASNKLNPSGRRDGIRVIYSCELCSDYSSLNISQHKGATIIEAEKCPDELIKVKTFVTFEKFAGGEL